jgi:hypothetical protein
MPDNALTQREQHAVDRAMERYGLEVDRTTLRHIAQLCRDGKAGKLEETDRVIVFELHVGGVLCRIIYHRRDREVLTFLPRREWGCHTPQGVLEQRRREITGGMQSSQKGRRGRKNR